MLQSAAFIGTGIMGGPMAGHLLKAGIQLTVNNRTKARAQPLIEQGAKWADTPADAAGDVDVVFICVPDTPDVEKVINGPDGVLSAARKGLIVVDHSTISPSATREMAKSLQSKGASLLDAPVSGGDVGARNATLSIMVGGDRQAFDSVKPLLERMGKTITYCGQSGNGQLTKLANQILVSINNLAVCEALTFAKKCGLDPTTTIAAVAGGGAGSWQLSNLGPRMVARDFAPGFMIDLQLKDLNLVVDAAKQAGMTPGGVEMVKNLFAQAVSAGRGKEGTQALIDFVEAKTRAG